MVRKSNRLTYVRYAWHSSRYRVRCLSLQPLFSKSNQRTCPSCQAHNEVLARNDQPWSRLQRTTQAASWVHRLGLGRRSRHQTINGRLRLQRRHRRHQLELQTPTNGRTIILRSRIHGTNTMRKGSNLAMRTTARTSSTIQAWRPSNNHPLRGQPRGNCHGQKPTIPCQNQTH
jgi:hypothetical protein